MASRTQGEPLDRLLAGEFIIVLGDEEAIFDSVGDMIRWIRLNWHPKAKALHLRRIADEVSVYSADRRKLSWLTISVARFWKEPPHG